jgi:ubiquinone/menaquinone biosynthesis C-methylase UbiE
MTTVSYRTFTGTAAENYQRYFVPAIGEPVSGLLLDAAAIQPGERVVDVACGTGVIARLAAERVGPAGSVTGIDISPDMLAVAGSTAAPAFPAIEWRPSNATSLDLADGCCDVVTCQLGLMFVEEPVAALAEMRRVLRPAGRAVVSTAGRIQPPFEIMERAIVEHIGAELGGFVRAVFSMHDADVQVGMLRQAGFADVTAHVETVPLRLPAPVDFLWQYINLTPMGGFVAQASAAQQSAMEQQVVEAWQPHVVDGRLRLDQPMVVVTGRNPAG